MLGFVISPLMIVERGKRAGDQLRFYLAAVVEGGRTGLSGVACRLITGGLWGGGTKMIVKTTRQIARLGIPLTTIAVAVLYLLGSDYWAARLKPFGLDPWVVEMSFQRIVVPNPYVAAAFVAGLAFYLLISYNVELQRRRKSAADAFEKIRNMMEVHGISVEDFDGLNRSPLARQLLSIVPANLEALGPVLAKNVDEILKTDQEEFSSMGLGESELMLISRLTKAEYRGLLSFLATVAMGAQGKDDVQNQCLRILRLRGVVRKKWSLTRFEQALVLVLSLPGVVLWWWVPRHMVALDHRLLIATLAMGCVTGALLWVSEHWVRSPVTKLLVWSFILWLASLLSWCVGRHDALSDAPVIQIFTRSKSENRHCRLIVATAKGYFLTPDSTEDGQKGRQVIFIPSSEILEVKHHSEESQ